MQESCAERNGMEIEAMVVNDLSQQQMVQPTTSAVRQNGFLFKRGKIRTAKRELHSNRPPQKMAA